MRTDRWHRIEAVFQGAADLSAEARRHYLEKECREDLELRSEVEKLLADLESAESFIERPVWTDSFFAGTGDRQAISDSLEKLAGGGRDESLVGRRVGAYELVRELGRGGMGAVYLAERADGEFRQKVAVKLIKRGMDSDFIVKRFRHERQILASFEHPYIARLLDGGTTDDGLPYFVMEFIEGDSLYEYCDRQKLTVRERLDIFRQICSAISYAHERQIIHRDIKPGNILFTRTGVPKLLDFGIAKILDTELIHESVSPTASIVRLMTPDYASPEQINGAEITPASDIYSLGVLLYELLTGHRPYDFAGRSLHEISRMLCEVYPELPAETIGREAQLLPQYEGRPERVAETRRTDLRTLKKMLRGGIERILMKSLAKNPGERYASAEEFSGDIARYLSGEEVRARAFVPKKNAEPVPVYEQSAGKTLAVLPFKTINLSPEEDTGDSFLGLGLADALITRLSRVGHFVVRPTGSILGFGDGVTDVIAAARELQVDYILDGNIKRAGQRLRITVQLLDAARNATVWATSIDETITDLFSLEDTISTRVVEALLPQMSSRDLEEFSNRGTDNPEAFEHYLRGRYYFNISTEEGFAKAFVSFHRAIAEDPNYAHAYAGLADYYSWLGIVGVLPPGECFQSAIDMAEKAVELDDQLAEAHATLGFSIHAGNYDWSKAEYHLGRALELNPNYATAFAWFGIVRFSEGRFEEGLEFARQAVKLDPLTPFNHHNIGWGLYYARRFDECIAQYRKVTAEFPNYGFGFYGLSKALRFEGRTEESLTEIGNCRKIFGESNFIRLAEAETLAAAGDREETLRILAEMHELSAERFVSPYQTALVYCYLGDRENAFVYLEKAAEMKEAWLNWIGVEPVFDILRDDERFQRILDFTGYDVFFGIASIGSRSFMERKGPETLHDQPTLHLGGVEPVRAAAVPSKRFRTAALLYAFAGMLVLLFVWGIVHLTTGPAADPSAVASLPRAQSVAILPFKTEHSASENLGVGLADALSNRLGYIRRLSVIAPNSARLSADRSLAEIGRDMKVGYVLRGTLAEREQNNIRVTAEMVRTDDGAVVWTEVYDVADGDLFRIQSRIAEKIWTSLGLEPLPNERQQVLRDYTRSNAAYELYLIGRYQLANRSPENIRKAINTFTQARDADPDFALAYVGLADAYALLRSYEMPPPPDAYALAKQNALKAIELDESLVEAHTSLAYIKFYGDRDREGSELSFRRAIQLNPSYSQAHHWFGLLLLSSNRPMDALDEIRIAAELDPESNIIRTALAMTYFHNRRYDEAIRVCDEVLARNKEFVPAFKVLRWAYLMKKDYQSARAVLQKEMSYSGGEANDPGWAMIVAQVEALRGEASELVERLDRAVSDPVVSGAPAAFSYENALAFNMLGDADRALKWLERAEAAGDNGFILLEVDPRLENLRQDPRYKVLLEKLKTR